MAGLGSRGDSPQPGLQGQRAMQPGWGVTLGPVGFAPPSVAAQPRRMRLSISSFYVLRQQWLKATVSVTLVSDQDGGGCLSPTTLVPSAGPAPQQGADRTPSRGPTAGCCALAVFSSPEPPSLPSFSSPPTPPPLPHLLLMSVSLQEPVGSDLRSIHLFHLSQRRCLEQDPGPRALGAAPNICDGQVDAGSGFDVPRAGVQDAGQRAEPWGRQEVRQEGQDSVGGDEAQGRGVPCSPRSPRPSQRLLSTGRSLRSCLISSRIFSCRVLCFWGKGRSLLSDTCRGCGSTTLGASSLEALRALAGSVPEPTFQTPRGAGTCFSGGRERMKSRMSSWASFFTLGGMSPSTCGREGGQQG